MKRKTALLMAGVMTMSTLSGCGKGVTNSPASTAKKNEIQETVESHDRLDNLTAPGEFPIVKDKITLTVTTVDVPNIGNLKDTDFFKWYEDKTNIHIEFTELPQEGYMEKLNLMLTTGNLPDIFLAVYPTTAQITTYGSEGVFLALNDYIETYGVETKKALAQYEGVEEMIAAADGKIYSLPSLNDTLHSKYYQRAWINTEWLDNLKLQMPETTEEFEAVLQAFKDQDPNKNGKADEIPMMGDATSSKSENVALFLLNAFIYTEVEGGAPYFYLEDGNVKFIGDKEEYKQGLAWINSLVNKGLIDPTSFTQDINQHKQMSVSGDNAVVGVERADIITKITGLYNDTPDHRISQYKVLPPLTGPNGFRVQPSNIYRTPIQGSFIITNTCKNPEAAFRWADAWYAEDATVMSWHGKEGVGWEKPTEGALGLNGKPALYKTIVNEATNSPEQLIRVVNKFGNNTAILREGEEVDWNDPEVKYGVEPVLFEGATTLKEYAKPEMTVPPLAFTKEETEDVMRLQTSFEDYMQENMANFCLGTKSIEDEWDNYVAEFSVMGLDRLTEIYQTAYDRQYK